MKQKHTPGPWIIGNNNYDVHSANQDFTEICTAFNKNDARLIASAPELFETLKYVLSAIDVPVDEVLIEKVRDAIAKAEGKP